MGANVTVIVHWPFGGSGVAAWHVSLIENCAGFVPPSVGAAMCMKSFPVFLTVTVWAADNVKTGWFPNEIDPGDTSATAAMPRPVSWTSCPSTVSVPFCCPTAFGEKTTRIVQLSCAASWPPQPA